MGAVIISLSGNPSTGPQFVIGTGTSSFVLDGSLIRVGTFTSPPTATGSFESFASTFHEFGRTTMGHTTASAPVNQGRLNRTQANSINGSDTADSPDPDSFFVDKTVYIWVYGTATADASAPQGIFSTTQSTFKDQAAALTLSVNQFITGYGQLPGGNPTSVDTANNLATFFHLSAPAIPEPTSVATFGLLGFLGLMRRRR
jgi:hypothetical protein